MIFFFSATGNSKNVASIISEVTGEPMISITECMKNETFNFDVPVGERIGFITPVYC